MGALALGVSSVRTVVLMPLLIANLANASEAPRQPNSAQIQLALRKLGVVGSVLFVAAHPDDENTKLLAYLANERLLRTAYLSLTRGDGGQNLIGAEQGAELGVIRTQELLAARRIDGAEQFFTRARDFGYSKHPEETLRIWGQDAVLADVVHVIRRFRPDVIVTRFSPVPSETHGHHTASAQLTLEAFRAAGDPAFCPEQLHDGVSPWQARRLYWNPSQRSLKPGEDLSDFIKLDVNGYSPLLGLSYGEMAAESRSMHKTQGFGIERSRVPIVEYFKLLAADAEAAPAAGLLDGLDFTWKRMKGTATLARLVQQAHAGFRATAPHASVPILLRIAKALDGVPDPTWRDQKQAEVRDLLAASTGLFVEALAAEPRVVPGDALAVTLKAINRSPASMRLREVRLIGAKLADPELNLRPSPPVLGSIVLETRVQTAAELPLSTPHWLALPPEPGLYRVAEPTTAILPVLAPALQADFLLELEGHAFSLRRPLTFKWTDPVAGERYRPVEVLPRVSVQPRHAVLVLPNGEAGALVVQVSGASGAVSGRLAVEAPPGWTVNPPARPFSLTGDAAGVELDFRVQPPAAATASTTSATLRVVARVGDARFAAAVVHLEHDHIPTQVVLHSSEVRAVSFPLDRQVGAIGYVAGPGDQVAASLRQAGYDVRTITDDVLAPGVLKDLAAVVIGVRAFNTSARLRAAQPMLMAYVWDGGTVVAQYNTNNRLAPLSAPIGPFPFEIGSERVTDETAQVTFTAPAHRLLTWPNRIAAPDFEGWVQERGLYFARAWDSRYETMLRMNDPGEPPRDGSVVFARHGKGAFVYTGLSFFRQLPAGVPGAFRLFANLLAAGQGQHGR
jgi:LmbE family N-acetylglucosaminyl deacetylase